MAKRKKKRRSLLQLLREGWFYRIYFGLLALCAVALAVGLTMLSGVLREYEATRPVHVAEEVLDLLNRGEWARLREIDESAKKLKYDAPETYVEYMNNLAQGREFTLKSVLSIDDDEQKFNLLMDGQKAAELTLEPSGETTAHNFARWRLKRFESTAFAPRAYEITVPSDSAVTVNGVALTQEDVLEANIATAAEGNLPEGIAAPTMTKYGVYMLAGEPEDVRVVDRDGSAQTLVRDEAGARCELPYDDSIKAQCEDSVVQWGRRLAAYTTGDYDKFDLANACVNPSPARTFIRNMDNKWASAHDGCDFQNIETRDYYVYSDSCFSCRISFDYIVHYASGDKSTPTQYTLYFSKDGGRFKLYSFTMN